MLGPPALVHAALLLFASSVGYKYLNGICGLEFELEIETGTMGQPEFMLELYVLLQSL